MPDQPIRPKLLMEGIDLIKAFESFKPNAYYDTGGVLTIGYGTTKYDKPDLTEKSTIDQATADSMLPQSVDRNYGQKVLDIIKVPINDQQYSALASFAYNVGPTAFQNSTMLKKLNLGDYESASKEFARWNKVKGKEEKGLTDRRAAEKALFEGNVDELGRRLEEKKFGPPKNMFGKWRNQGINASKMAGQAESR
jgi:lysozyme